MSKFLVYITFLFLFLAGRAQNIHQYWVQSINGNSIPLSAFNGKKLLIVTLPIVKNASADSVLHAIDSISTAYSSSLKVIGFPAYEDGYTQSISDSLFAWYKNILGSGVIISKAAYTHKRAGMDQHDVFKWLTRKELNQHVNKDVTGPLNKFIIYTNGQLAAVFEESTRFNSSAIKEILDMP